MKVRYARDAFPKKCRCCGRAHDRTSWAYLERLEGTQELDERWDLELRNCHCGSTLAVRVKKS